MRGLDRVDDQKVGVDLVEQRGNGADVGLGRQPQVVDQSADALAA